MFASRILRNAGPAWNKPLADHITARTGDKAMLYTIGGMGALGFYAYWMGYNAMGHNNVDNRDVAENLTSLERRAAKPLHA